MSSSYDDFLANKILRLEESGFTATAADLPSVCFQDQIAVVLWALRRGRAAVFADTGLGKTLIEVAWANAVRNKTGKSVLIVAPLSVSHQTCREAKRLADIDVQFTREAPDAYVENAPAGIYITNYENLENFASEIEGGFFGGLVLDESSILKHESSKTRTRIIQLTRNVLYKLSCTATPSPNDHMELGSQAEFLGVMSAVEMLATFFTHDSGETSKWRLKGHGASKFWEWLAQWSVTYRRPSDLGFSDERYFLPKLEMREVMVPTGIESSEEFETLAGRNKARRLSVEARARACADIVNATDKPFLIWCNLNDEGDLLEELIPGAVQVSGSDKDAVKEDRMLGFSSGKYRVLITKPKIAGFGMNWQHCNQVAFVGLNDSYEQMYQGIRRCWRNGQREDVTAYLFSADIEGATLENIKRKEAQDAERMESLIAHMRDFQTRNVSSLYQEKAIYQTDVARHDRFELHLGDCVEVARNIRPDSIGFSVFSPPFASLYTYSNSDRDMGNSRSYAEFWTHFSFLLTELFRIMAPGRNVSIHCMDLPLSKTRDGFIGIRDFSGDIIRGMTDAGFIYHSKVTVWKDPVVAMQRTKALGLLWKQLRKDSAMSRQGIPDYLITFRKPGENPKPISHTPEEFPVGKWQHYASPCWMDIKQSNTLNRKGAKEDQDERHIAPLQLDLIERALELWSAPGDQVYSPFAGIGSEGYVALQMGRNFIGSELKRSYFDIARKNLSDALSIQWSPKMPPVDAAAVPAEGADQMEIEGL